MMAQKTARSKHRPLIDCHGEGVAHWKAVSIVDILETNQRRAPMNTVAVLTQTIASSTPSTPVAFTNVENLALALTQTRLPLHLPEIL